MKQDKIIRIGTRGSKLALYQANKVKGKLEENFPHNKFELTIIETKGDKILDRPLAQIGDKGLFTQEIEQQLLNGSIDMAVHSLKDLPTLFPKGLKIGAIVKRADSRDAIVSNKNLTLNTFNRAHTVATSSLRRKACLLNLNPHLNIIDIRGNVDTRIRKMEEGYCDAIIMASAGLKRLNLTKHISEYLDRETLIPAPGQGAIAIEIVDNNSAIEQLVYKINHTETATAVIGERSFLHRLEGGCQVPMGCFSIIHNSSITLTGFISSVDGTRFIRESYTGSVNKPVETGISLAEILLHNGGSEIIKNL